MYAAMQQESLIYLLNPDPSFFATAYFPTLLIQINMDQNHIAHTASSNLPATNDIAAGFLYPT